MIYVFIFSNNNLLYINIPQIGPVGHFPADGPNLSIQHKVETINQHDQLGWDYLYVAFDQNRLIFLSVSIFWFYYWLGLCTSIQYVY